MSAQIMKQDDAESGDKEKKKKKKRKRSKVENEKRIFAAQSVREHKDPQPSLNLERNFDADPNDHCETPFQAYRDIEPFLYIVARSLKKDKKSLRIYDPYYCEGSVIGHLNALGFACVYNRQEDFYKVIENDCVPEHDVLVSNPPFSGSHMERVIQFAQNGNRGRPWLLLMPNFVCRKPTYQSALNLNVQKDEGSAIAIDNFVKHQPFFLVPKKRYSFWSPGRIFKADADRIRERMIAGVQKLNGKHTAPFECMWYIQLSDWSASAFEYWNKKYSKLGQCSLAKNADHLPEHAFVPRHEKRKSSRSRKRIKLQKSKKQ